MNLDKWKKELDKMRREVEAEPDDAPAKEQFVEFFKQLDTLNELMEVVQTEVPEKLEELKKRLDKEKP